MYQIVTGNFDKEALSHKGWILGHFVSPTLPLHNRNFEMKWGKHKKGESKTSIGVNERASTLSILIYGKVLLKFPSQSRESLLEEEGDYVFWGPGIPHKWEVLEDSLVLTVRWPSVPGDQRKLLIPGR